MPIHYEKKGKIAYITIDGRGDLNPVTSPMYDEMLGYMVDFRDDPDLSVAIITGAGEKASYSKDQQAKIEIFWSEERVTAKLIHRWTRSFRITRTGFFFSKRQPPQR